MLPRNLRQEALSRPCVRAGRRPCGCHLRRNGNDLGFDLLLRAVEVHGQQCWASGPADRPSTPSTTQAGVRDAEVLYDLDVRTYDCCVAIRALVRACWSCWCGIDRGRLRVR